MDTWQEEFIRENRHKLIKTTICSKEVLAVLLSKGVIGEYDMEEIKTTDNRIRKAAMLYEILQTRRNGYEAIAEALTQSGQTGARDLLLTGYLVYGIKLPSQFSNCFQTWSCLDQKGKEAILLKRISVYGESYSLEKIASLITSEKLNDICKKYIFGEVLSTLLERCGDVIKIKEPAIPKLPPKYISRIIAFRSNLSLEILNHACEDLIVIKKIKWHDLSNITSKNRISTSSMYIRDNANSLLLHSRKDLHVECVLLEQDEHYEKICKFSQHPVHLLQYQRTHFEWLRSSGSMNFIQNCITKQQNQISEKLFILNLISRTNNNAPVLIADSPGMGKSTLLVNMWYHSKKCQTNKLVIFLVITDLIQSFLITKEKLNVKTVMKHIARKCCAESLFESLVEEILLSLFPVLGVELYFDGFDELLVNQNPIMTQVLQIIQNDWPNSQVFVTTRKHLMLDLENTLHVLGHTILPFNRENQTEFLLAYWTIEAGISYNTQLQNFANKCLDFLETNAYESNIAGVPLQCCILAEIYSAKAKTYAHHQENEQVDENFINAKSVFDMFARLIEIRFGRLDTDQKQIDEDTSILVRFWNYLINSPSFKEKVKDAHVFAATQILFPEHSQKFNTKLLSNNSNYLPQILSVGLLEKLPEETMSAPRFFHRTFAEYLLADFIIDIMVRNKKTYWSESQRLIFTRFFICEVLETCKTANTSIPQMWNKDDKFLEAYEFSNIVVCYFLNYILRNVEHADLKYFTRICDQVQHHLSGWFRLLMACIYHGYLHIFRLLAKTFLQQIRYASAETQFEMTSTLMCLASGYADAIFFEEVSYICSLMHSNNETVMKQHQNICSAAAKGNLDVFYIVLKSVDLCQVKSVMQYCVTNSLNNPPYTIQRKIEILTKIVEESPHSINEIIRETGQTPLLMPDMALDIIKILIKNGANTLARCSKFGNMFMHNAMAYLSNQELQELTQLLFDVGKFKVFGIVNYQQRTPLEEMLVKKQTTAPLSVAKFILESEPTISSLYGYCVSNSVNDPTELIVHKESIICLVNTKASYGINEADKTLNTVPLLMENIAFDIIKALITNGANTLTKCIGTNDTFLHKAARYLSVSDLCKLVKFLHQNDKFEVFGLVNNMLCTPLEEMLLQKSNNLPEHIIEFILDHEPKISGIYAYCVSNSLHDPTYIIEHKAKIIGLVVRKLPNSLNEPNKTLNSIPLLMNNIALDIIKVLVDNGANTLVRKKGSKDTFVHQASTYLSADELYELAKYLFDKGKFDVFGSINNKLLSPLEEILLQKQHSLPLQTIRYILERRPTISGIYSYCVNNSLHDSFNIINYKASIISIVTSVIPNSINECDRVINAVPVLMNNIALEILTTLISKGANVFVKCKVSKDTLLHRAAKYMPAKELDELVKFLFFDGKFELFGTINNKLRTPLEEMLVRKQQSLPLHTIEFILDRKPTISTLYSYCVSNSRNDAENIIEHKASIISMVATKIPQSINETDNKMETVPLLMDNIALGIIKVLVNNGANVLAKCKTSNDTFMHKTAKYLSANELYELVKFLFNNGKFELFGIADNKEGIPLEEMIVQQQCYLLRTPRSLKLKPIQLQKKEKEIHWKKVIHTEYKQIYFETLLS